MTGTANQSPRLSRVAIVGAGPWGTYALERLAARADDLVRKGLKAVTVYDASGSFGDGRVHSASQVHTNTLNTVTSQIALGADESQSDDVLPPELRPTLAQWIQRQFVAKRDLRYHLGAQDISSRAVLGEALREAFAIYRDRLIHHGVQVHLVHGMVTDVIAEEHCITIRCGSDDQFASSVGAVLLTTGHGPQSAGPYPLSEAVTEEEVPPGSRVAIDGSGLSSIDVILHLTEGRGGSFKRPLSGAAVPVYVPGGREPAKIYAVSPSGLFSCARPRNHKAVDTGGVEHRRLELVPRWFTHRNIEALFSQRTSLDFDRDVLPLIVAEMGLTYYSRLAGAEYTEALAATSDPLIRDFVHCAAQGRSTASSELSQAMYGRFTQLWRQHDDLRSHVRSVLDELPVSNAWHGSNEAAERLRFEWGIFADPLAGVGHDQWPSAVRQFMRWDLACAEQGNVRNPWKASWDGVWRDLRPLLARVLNFDGVTPESKSKFLATHWRTYARHVNGVGIPAATKLLSAIEAGIVDLRPGPRARIERTPPDGLNVVSASGTRLPIDAVLCGRVPRFSPDHPEHPYGSMLSTGTLTFSSHGGPQSAYVGMNLSKDFHPTGTTGRVDKRITILGPPTEGIVFFQFALARPHSGSSVMSMVEAWARELMDGFA